MADLDDEVGEDLVEDAQGLRVRVWDLVGGAAGRCGGPEAVQEVFDCKRERKSTRGLELGTFPMGGRGGRSYGPRGN